LNKKRHRDDEMLEFVVGVIHTVHHCRDVLNFRLCTSRTMLVLG
jgi:hypothetical protein